mgnify:FL=1
MDAHILLVEDEADIASFIQRGLTEEGCVVTWVTEGEQALDELRTSSVDVMLLDIRLPGMSGMEVLTEVRTRLPHLPVMMLTALDAVEDRVAGLRSGADDYLPKPFDFEELLARVEALLRRAGSPNGDDGDAASSVLRAGNLRLDLAAHTCTCAGAALELTPKEFDLLAYFMAHPGEALQRAQIHRDVWGHDFDRGTNLIDVYVAYVRGKLNKTTCGDACIETVRGVGYRFVPANNANNAESA